MTLLGWASGMKPRGTTTHTLPVKLADRLGILLRLDDNSMVLARHASDGHEDGCF